jgi:hypothetical protein
LISSQVVRQIIKLPHHEIPDNGEIVREIEYLENFDALYIFAIDEFFRKCEPEKRFKVCKWLKQLAIDPEE